MSSPNHGPISGYYQNCRGLRSKLPILNCNASALNYFFIVLTETWLSNNFSDSELGLCHYNVFRYDRCNYTSNCVRGGGVLIGIRKDIPAYLIKINQLNVEHIFVRFSIGSFNFIIGGVYIPPRSSPSIYESHISTVESLLILYPDHTFIVCGDYNLPGFLEQ